MDMPCGGCGREPGELHSDGCPVERCPDCGRQLLSCGCNDLQFARMPWTGDFPGTAECAAFGWFSALIPGKGWVRCEPGVPGAFHDMNRLYSEAVWNPRRARFVLPPGSCVSEIVR